MKNENRIQNLQKLDYTEREAAFLCGVALHGGYFLRRQYNYFLGQEPGGAAERLIEKALGLGHLTVLPSTDRTRIYHVGSRAFYKVIDQEDNRNRRTHESYAILQRLMALDFVLAHPSFDYLATEQERVDYFEQTAGIPRQKLPTKLYTSPRTGQVTARYFVDKNPIFLPLLPEGSAPRMVHFGYVDASLGRPSGFETYLQQYRLLMAALPAFALVYIARDPHVFERAERLFLHLGPKPQGGETTAADGQLSPRMLAYFEARQAFDAKRYDQFDQRRLDNLREARETFRSAHVEALYEAWQQGGELTVSPNGRETPDQTGGLRAVFSTYHTPHSYDFFGALAQVV